MDDPGRRHLLIDRGLTPRRSNIPRFFFDIIDQGIIQVDEEGMEFPDLAAAVADAQRAAKSMAVEALPGSPIASVSIQVRDGPTTPVVTVLARADAAELSQVVYHTRQG